MISNVGFNDINDDATRWLRILIHIYIHILYNDFYEMSLGHSDVTQYYRLLWMTCDRGRIWGNFISLHQGCMGNDSSKRMVGVSA